MKTKIATSKMTLRILSTVLSFLVGTIIRRIFLYQGIFLFLLAPDTAAVFSAEGALDLADVFLVLLYGFLLLDVYKRQV